MDVSTYTAGNLIDTICIDPWAVRNEAAKRHDAMAKKIAAAKAKLAKLVADAEKMAAIHSAALEGIRIEQDAV